MVLLIIMLITLTVGGYFGVRALNLAVNRSGLDDREAEQILSQAKAALLAWSVVTEDNDPYAGNVTGTYGLRAFRPGNLPYPDLVDTTTLARPSDGVRDHGCARTTWTGTQALIPVTLSMSGPNKTRIRCFGRLPLSTVGLDRFAVDSTDSAGRWPWYAVSANLVNISRDCPYRLDGTILGVGAVTTCLASDSETTTRLAFPWITVLDPAGVTISTRAAAVILLPGPVTTIQPGDVRQTRSATALPSAFLDTVDSAACAARPAGRCDNSLLNQSPDMFFIQCVKPGSTTGDPRFNAKYACNDRLSFITIDELMNHAAKRMEREFASCLVEFARLHGGDFPWAASLTDPSSVVVNQYGPGVFPSNDEAFNLLCPGTMNQKHYSNYWGGWQRDVSYLLAGDRKSASFALKSFPGRRPVEVR